MMKKSLSLLMIMAMVVASLGGCANIKDDATRTKTEGGLAGAGIGAGVGAIAGALIGGKRGALLGAGIGAAVGGGAGVAYGAHVAGKKAEYASTEQWLDACIAQAKADNEQLRGYNSQLAADIETLSRESAKLQKSYAAKKAQKSQLIAQKNSIAEKVKKNEGIVAAANKEIEEQNKALAQAQKEGKNEYATALNQEISSLKQQRDKLQASNTKLVALSSRLSV
jgi:uncharacterized protein YcfJ